VAGRIARDAVCLAWLPPSVSGLEAWLRPQPDVSLLRHDPGLVLHRLRFLESARQLRLAASSETAWETPALCLAAARAVATPACFTWLESSAGQFWHRVGLRLACLAWHVAQHCDRGLADAAWTAGLLTPLGSYAVAATQPQAAAVVQSDPDWVRAPAGVERQTWGASATEIARQLIRRWRLPAWVALAVGWPELPVATIQSLGGSLQLLEILAVCRFVVREQAGGAIPLPAVAAARLPQHLLEFAFQEASHAFALADTALEAVTRGSALYSTNLDSPTVRRWLAGWLRSVARERQARLDLAEAERWRDVLTGGLLHFQEQFAQAVEEAKLASLAEFAAGASHEINNPLTVISGNAQLLRGQERDPQRLRQLDAIIRSSQRIHQLLQSTRQFARPVPPRPQCLDLTRWLLAEQQALTEQATADPAVEVEFRIGEQEQPVWVSADPDQLRTALQQVVRNAIEASRARGPVIIRLEASPDQAEIVVEDSGPGPCRQQIPHLFDPFYCGRSAGRQAGLGLSIAWRLLKENGGQLRYAPQGSIPGRFVLQIPRRSTGCSEHRKSA
jgi:two-component system NtrC family sensor kinase